jgi:7-carboxy-7-deazaguanine synthase
MNKYAINDIYPCIQGEGCNTGMPMVMVRLQGCSVGCSFCDTKWSLDFSEEDQRVSWEEIAGDNHLYAYKTAEEIVDHIKGFDLSWVLLSGGEPAEQDLKELTKELHKAGYKIAIETSGTEPIEPIMFDWITVSPKIKSNKPINPHTVFLANEIKFLIGREEDMEDLRQFIVEYNFQPRTTICIQPLSLNKKATVLCIKEASSNGYRLSLQTHKLYGIR